MKLGKGINYSRYCWQWRGSEANDLNNYMDGTNPSGTNFVSPISLNETRDHIALIKKLGFDTIRLPITFHCWSRFNNNQIDPNHPYWSVLDTFIDTCTKFEINLVISYHHAPTMNQSRVLSQWQQIAQRPTVLAATNKVVFEVFNEPTNEITNDSFRTNAIALIQAIRAIPQHANRWVVVGGNWWNDIGFSSDTGLIGFTPIAMPNIIYTFHSYEPKVFTNQGFKGEPCFHTKGISFPAKLPLPAFVKSEGCNNSDGVFKYDNYDKDAGNGTGFGMGTVEFIKTRIKEAKQWSVRNGNLPVWCGEWGTHRHTPTIPNDGSVGRFLKAMIDAFKTENIDWCWWDFEGAFTIFNPVPDVVNLDDAFGVATCIDDNVDATVREMLGLFPRVKIRILSTKRNETTKKDTFKVNIECLDHISAFRNYELTYQVTSKTASGVVRKQLLKKVIVPKKSVTFDLTGIDLIIIHLQVNYSDGRLRLHIPE
jgi:endoglucanase